MSNNHPGKRPRKPSIRGNQAATTDDREASTEDLRATADSIQEDAAELAGIEQAKSRLEVDDPAVGRLSEQAVDLANAMTRKTRAEQALSKELA
jgi:hypothetical protein